MKDSLSIYGFVTWQLFNTNQSENLNPSKLFDHYLLNSFTASRHHQFCGFLAKLQCFVGRNFSFWLTLDSLNKQGSFTTTIVMKACVVISSFISSTKQLWFWYFVIVHTMNKMFHTTQKLLIMLFSSSARKIWERMNVFLSGVRRVQLLFRPIIFDERVVSLAALLGVLLCPCVLGHSILFYSWLVFCCCGPWWFWLILEIKKSPGWYDHNRHRCTKVHCTYSMCNFVHASMRY